MIAHAARRVEGLARRSLELGVDLELAVVSLAEEVEAGRPWLVVWDQPAMRGAADYQIHIKAHPTEAHAATQSDALRRLPAGWPSRVVIFKVENGAPVLRLSWRRRS